MTSEAQELLKLIDGHIRAITRRDKTFNITRDVNYYAGMKSIRWLVYNFFNAPRPKTEPSPLTEEELKLLTTEEEDD